ncbi:glycoside hydrolase family 125 protein [Proteinivorax tanatarense]|uniref:Glycoside hydrolase family 125 protein n=1 Tax=Proteinivorax tanatarense TaxID=1260629 RepID=A0AAU7VPN5_9FIRM
MANKIITKPKEISENPKVLYTGNHYIAIPIIDCKSGGVKSINLLSSTNKALVEVEGRKDLFYPKFYKGDKGLKIEKIEGEKELFYSPRLIFHLEFNIKVVLKLYADLCEKGFVFQFESNENIEVVLEFNVSQLNLLRFNSHPVKTDIEFMKDKWLSNPVVNLSSEKISLAMGFGGEKDFTYKYDKVLKLAELKVKCNRKNAIYVTVNSDPDGASTTLIHLKRKGYHNIYNQLISWLKEKIISYSPDKQLEKVMNENLFFNYFYAIGKDMDTDQYIALTSRSPRYYVSGAFWERDSFLWSFPAIKLIDYELHRELSREMIIMHSKNPGDHAHYIDGTVLYPGFELDEAASYFILLGELEYNYIDDEIMRAFLKVWNSIEKRYDEETRLYSTFLLPSDDPAEYPFVTINNVILHRGLLNYKKLLEFKGEYEKGEFISRRIEGIELGIKRHLLKKVKGKKMFLWSADGKGNFRLYNDPPGNLGLLCYYNYVDKDDKAFVNTINYYYSTKYKYFFEDAKIQELACDHHPNTPSGLGLCGSILNPIKRKEALRWLKHARMDNGLLSESYDKNTGEGKTGVGFATGSGYLAFALYYALIKEGLSESSSSSLDQ